jgi:hypothetical protein
MRSRNSLVVLAAAFALLAVAPAPRFIGVARAGCDAGDRIDKTTAGETKKKLEAAGYKQVSDLMKGCDNTWHAKAMKDGAPARVAVSSSGQIMPEGD